eukprot:1179653-Prorocentrum_minimum.AAC.5
MGKKVKSKSAVKGRSGDQGSGKPQRHGSLLLPQLEQATVDGLKLEITTDAFIKHAAEHSYEFSASVEAVRATMDACVAKSVR